MTYFTDTELPLTVEPEDGWWRVTAKWDNGTCGVSVKYEEEPDETTLQLLRMTFMDSYKDAVRD